MDKIKVNWTEEKFTAYLMIYASQTDQIETEEEKDFLELHFDQKLLKEIYKEINKDNDFDRIQKIISFVKEKKYSENEIKTILNKIKQMYMCDGSFDASEKMVYSMIQKLLKIN